MFTIVISDINIEFRVFFSLDDVLYNVGHVQRVCTDKYKHKILRTRHCSSVWILRVFLGRWGFHRGTHKLFCKFLNFEWAATKNKCWEHATKYLKILSWCTLIICFFIDSLLDSLGITFFLSNRDALRQEAAPTEAITPGWRDTFTTFGI